jgi:hypothetical protein
MNFTRHSHDGHPLEPLASPVPGPISSGHWGAQVQQAAELAACPCHRSGADRAPRADHRPARPRPTGSCTDAPDRPRRPGTRARPPSLPFGYRRPDNATHLLSVATFRGGTPASSSSRSGRTASRLSAVTSPTGRRSSERPRQAAVQTDLICAAAQPPEPTFQPARNGGSVRVLRGTHGHSASCRLPISDLSIRP